MDIENLNPSTSTIIENNTNDVVLDKDVETGTGACSGDDDGKINKDKKFVFN